MHTIIHHDAAILEPCSYKRTLGCLRGWAPEYNLFTERTSLEQTAPCLRFWVPGELYIRGGEIGFAVEVNTKPVPIPIRAAVRCCEEIKSQLLYNWTRALIEANGELFL